MSTTITNILQNILSAIAPEAAEGLDASTIWQIMVVISLVVINMGIQNPDFWQQRFQAEFEVLPPVLRGIVMENVARAFQREQDLVAQDEETADQQVPPMPASGSQSNVPSINDRERPNTDESAETTQSTLPVLPTPVASQNATAPLESHRIQAQNAQESTVKDAETADQQVPPTPASGSQDIIPSINDRERPNTDESAETTQSTLPVLPTPVASQSTTVPHESHCTQAECEHRSAAQKRETADQQAPPTPASGLQNTASSSKDGERLNTTKKAKATKPTRPVMPTPVAPQATSASLENRRITRSLSKALQAENALAKKIRRRAANGIPTTLRRSSRLLANQAASGQEHTTHEIAKLDPAHSAQEQTSQDVILPEFVAPTEEQDQSSQDSVLPVSVLFTPDQTLEQTSLDTVLTAPVSTQKQTSQDTILPASFASAQEQISEQTSQDNVSSAPVCSAPPMPILEGEVNGEVDNSTGPSGLKRSRSASADSSEVAGSSADVNDAGVSEERRRMVSPDYSDEEESSSDASDSSSSADMLVTHANAYIQEWNAGLPPDYLIDRSPSVSYDEHNETTDLSFGGPRSDDDDHVTVSYYTDPFLESRQEHTYGQDDFSEYDDYRSSPRYGEENEFLGTLSELRDSQAQPLPTSNRDRGSPRQRRPALGTSPLVNVQTRSSDTDSQPNIAELFGLPDSELASSPERSQRQKSASQLPSSEDSQTASEEVTRADVTGSNDPLPSDAAEAKDENGNGEVVITVFSDCETDASVSLPEPRTPTNSSALSPVAESEQSPQQMIRLELPDVPSSGTSRAAMSLTTMARAGLNSLAMAGLIASYESPLAREFPPIAGHETTAGPDSFVQNIENLDLLARLSAQQGIGLPSSPVVPTPSPRSRPSLSRVAVLNAQREVLQSLSLNNLSPAASTPSADSNPAVACTPAAVSTPAAHWASDLSPAAEWTPTASWSSALLSAGNSTPTAPFTPAAASTPAAHWASDFTPAGDFTPAASWSSAFLPADSSPAARADGNVNILSPGSKTDGVADESSSPLRPQTEFNVCDSSANLSAWLDMTLGEESALSEADSAAAMEDVELSSSISELPSGEADTDELMSDHDGTDDLELFDLIQEQPLVTLPSGEAGTDELMSDHDSTEELGQVGLSQEQPLVTPSFVFLATPWACQLFTPHSEDRDLSGLSAGEQRMAARVVQNKRRAGRGARVLSFKKIIARKALALRRNGGISKKWVRHTRYAIIKSDLHPYFADSRNHLLRRWLGLGPVIGSSEPMADVIGPLPGASEQPSEVRGPRQRSLRGPLGTRGGGFMKRKKRLGRYAIIPADLRPYFSKSRNRALREWLGIDPMDVDPVASEQEPSIAEQRLAALRSQNKGYVRPRRRPDGTLRGVLKNRGKRVHQTAFPADSVSTDCSIC